MKWLYLVLTLAALGFTGFLVSCGMLSTEQMATVEATLADMQASGTITREQPEALVQSLHQAGTWPGALETLGVVGSSVLASLTGIQFLRGPSAGKAERSTRRTAKIMEKVPTAAP